MKLLISSSFVAKLAIYSFLFGLVLGLYLGVRSGPVAVDNPPSNPEVNEQVDLDHQPAALGAPGSVLGAPVAAARSRSETRWTFG